MTWVKDPDATKPYTLDWADYLDTDTLVAVAWSAPGLTIASSSNTDTTATVWLSGGNVGRTYSVRCRITSASGIVDDRTFEIEVSHQ